MGRKTSRLEVRLTPEQKALLDRAAHVSGQGLSGFALSTLTERALAILAAHEERTLSARDWASFLEVLDDDTPPPALVEAARRARPPRD